MANQYIERVVTSHRQTINFIKYVVFFHCDTLEIQRKKTTQIHTRTLRVSWNNSDHIEFHTRSDLFLPVFLVYFPNENVCCNHFYYFKILLNRT